MLDGLRVGDDAGIKHGLVVDLAGGGVGFLDETVDRRAIGALGLLAKLGKHLVEALDLIPGFDQMRLQTGLQVGIGRFSAISGIALVSCCSA